MAETHFDEWLARNYRRLWPHVLSPDILDAAVDTLTELAGPGPTLEFGVGTGRIALRSRNAASACTDEHLGYEEYDFDRQIAVSHHAWFIDGELRRFSSPHRYVWPAELDLMAQLAGLTLEARWSDWHRAPFTGDSRSHVSVWTAATT